MGASINCRERFEGKADGAQKPECTAEYMRISSTVQRSNQNAEQIERGVLKPHEQVDPVDKLIAHLDLPDKTIDDLWQKESESRVEAYEKGLIKSLTLGEVLEKYKNL
ncbi:addiction module protein [Chlorobium ferrooxidans]|uniref:Uncharacterized protein n=1 Tax=Chlorobium ferrooxidans DSM 13031 TaxID=377431 RepID=Q0YNX9_9CHLB|nr:addiction module protein [Chlorobium ferrooxidans]EAT58000.1 hypothetical protein CferDRAFT_0005 [Chlorobium ferrooxidans DSM 13031]